MCGRGLWIRLIGKGATRDKRAHCNAPFCLCASSFRSAREFAAHSGACSRVFEKRHGAHMFGIMEGKPNILRTISLRLKLGLGSLRLGCPLGGGSTLVDKIVCPRRLGARVPGARVPFGRSRGGAGAEQGRPLALQTRFQSEASIRRHAANSHWLSSD
jgi:hypothetical protein